MTTRRSPATAPLATALAAGALALSGAGCRILVELVEIDATDAGAGVNAPDSARG